MPYQMMHSPPVAVASVILIACVDRRSREMLYGCWLQMQGDVLHTRDVYGTCLLLSDRYAAASYALA